MKFLFFPMLCLYLGLTAQENIIWSNPQIVNAAQAYGFTRPKITLDGSGQPLIMWGRANNLDVYVSTLDGSEFGTPLKITPEGVYAFVQDWAGPGMAAAGDTVFVTFKSQPEDEGFIYAVRSLDGGKTFGDTVRVADENWSRFSEISVAPGGNPYITFMSFDPNFLLPHYVVSSSTNGGISFHPPVDASGGAEGESCDCCPGFILASAERVVVMFRNNKNNLRDIWTSVSTDGANSFSMGADIDHNNWMINSCPSSGPNGFVIADTLYATWMSGASGYSKINAGSIPLENLAGSTGFELTPTIDFNQNYPKIAGNEEVIGLAWQENRAGNTDLWFAWSTEGLSGLAKNTPVRINQNITGAQLNVDLTFRNNTFHFVWQDQQARRVMYRSAGIDISSSSESFKGEDEDVLIYPVPTTDIIHIELPKMDISRIELYNIAGKLVAAWPYRKVIQLDNVFPGVYYLKLLNNRNGAVVKKIIVQE